MYRNILNTRNPSYVKSFLEDCWRRKKKDQYKEDNGAFFDS